MDAGRQRHDARREIALDGGPLSDIGVGEDAPVPAGLHLFAFR